MGNLNGGVFMPYIYGEQNDRQITREERTHC